MYATQTRPEIRAVAEFQLIEDRNNFILGRLFIPAGVHGCVKGSLVRKMTWGKSTVIEFVPRDMAEVERCYKQYAASNMAGNRIRTVGLLQQLRAGRPICPVEEVVFTPVAIADPWDGVAQPAASTTPVAESRIIYLLPPSVEVEERSRFPMGEVKAVEVTLDDYLVFSVKDLKAIALNRGIKVPSKIKKQQLAELLFAA